MADGYEKDPDRRSSNQSGRWLLGMIIVVGLFGAIAIYVFRFG
jgi:hypothetical protein